MSLAGIAAPAAIACMPSPAQVVNVVAPSPSVIQLYPVETIDNRPAVIYLQLLHPKDRWELPAVLDNGTAVVVRRETFETPGQPGQRTVQLEIFGRQPGISHFRLQYRGQHGPARRAELLVSSRFSPPEPPPRPVEVSERDAGRTMQVDAGQDVAVRLKAPGTRSGQWVVQGQDALQPNATYRLALDPAAAVQGTFLNFRFGRGQPGQRLRLVFQPDDASQPEGEPFDFEIAPRPIPLC